ncbi:MAG: archease [Candidatus Omnitrophica bacterium]|nr:archease [Candidatus Omnitrophota bacterium]
MTGGSRGHETFEHTADIGIRAWGSEFSELFEEAAKALFSVIVDLKTVKPAQLIHIELSTEKKGTGNTFCLSPFFNGNAEELFLKWLKELLFLSETKHMFFSQFKILDLSPGKLVAEAEGESVDAKKHIMGREVKAITRHQFKLVHQNARYLAEIILDI